MAELFKSRYHESRAAVMGQGQSPRCQTLLSDQPYRHQNQLIFPFKIDQWQHQYCVEFPNSELISDPFLIGIALAEAYRLSEICTPQTIRVPWYTCQSWEAEWWNQDIYWYLQQKFYLERWDWSEMPVIEFGLGADAQLPSFQLQEAYLLAVSGGKESTFSFEWMQQAQLPVELFTLHNSGGIYGCTWEQKFPVFEYMQHRSPFWAIRAYPLTNAAQQFGYEGVRNDPTITNALFVMMMVAAHRGLKFLTLSNDKSSNEANAIYKGRSVNHQSAKGKDYIQRFNQFLERKAWPFVYVSMCEEVHSVKAVECLATWSPDLLKLLSSCNEAQWNPRSGQWCRQCSKCAFSFALIEAVTSRSVACDIVGEDLLLNPTLETTWESLYHPDREKPFECVGEKQETLWSLLQAKARRILNQEPLGFLERIPSTLNPSVDFSLNVPHNIPVEHQHQLLRVLQSGSS